jgi:hypothetical protein
MGDKEAVDGAVKDADLHLLVFLDRGDDVAQLRQFLRAEDVTGGMSKVTRQYDGSRRSSRICWAANVPSGRFMMDPWVRKMRNAKPSRAGPPQIDWRSGRNAVRISEQNSADCSHAAK